MDKQINKNVSIYERHVKLVAKAFAVLMQLIALVSVFPNWNDVKQYLLIVLLFGSWINILGIKEKFTTATRIALTIGIVALVLLIAVLMFDFIWLHSHQSLPTLINAADGFLDNLFLYSSTAGIAWWGANKIDCHE